MIGVGPFPIGVVIVAAALLLGWVTARMIAARQPEVSAKAAGGMLVDAAFWGLVAARLGYVAQWSNEYLAAPTSVIAIGDGGFSWPVGVVAAIALVGWRTRSARALRRPVLTGIAVGVLGWLVAGGVLDVLQRSVPSLPDVQLSTIDGRPVDLNAYAGRPVVLNLWASWCPPCRREMPVFEQAQADFPDVAFVMVNQGESPRQASAFLAREGLTFKDALLDPSSKTQHALGAQGLPTTLFFDAEGRLIDAHLGELSRARLKQTLSQRLAQPAQTHTDRK
ncbi:MAG: TlpA disulfide reductase family protein [Burkholderiaceae bacterium]